MVDENIVNRVTGSLLALALGDAFGAPYEGGLIERLLWRLIGTQNNKRRWTDDTQMTIDVMESLIQFHKVDQNDIAARFAESYRWSRGYGPGAARIIRQIRRGEPWESAVYSVYAGGSYGNGAAMRSPAVGLFFEKQGFDAVAKAADAVAAVTHAHPLAKEGATLIALGTALAFQGAGSQQTFITLIDSVQSQEHLAKLTLAKTWLDAGQDIAPREVASRLGNGIAAVNSCVTAIYISYRFMNSTFEDLLRFGIKVGGDVDTIGAMACAIWGAARGFGELPDEKLKKLEKCDELLGLSNAFAQVIGNYDG